MAAQLNAQPGFAAIGIADGYTAFQAVSATFGGDACRAGLLIRLPPGPYTTTPCDIHPSPLGRDILARTVVLAQGTETHRERGVRQRPFEAEVTLKYSHDFPWRPPRAAWVACGSKDGLLRVSQGVHGYLKEMGVPHVWNVDGNAHDTAEWQNNRYHFSRRIFK